MSYREALEDGIYINTDARGFHEYHPLCAYCAAPVPCWSYERHKKYVCRDCKETIVDVLSDTGRPRGRKNF